MNRVALVIDDDVSFLRLFQHELTLQRFEVITVESGLSAMEVIKRRRVHLLVTDMRMPLLDGYDVIYATKELYPDVPILLTTAHEVNDRVKRALRYESVVLLRKPFSVEEFRSAVAEIFPDRMDASAA